MDLKSRNRHLNLMNELFIDSFVKSHQSRHPGEPRIKSGAGAGVQKYLIFLDSGFRRNDSQMPILTFFELINNN